MWLPGLEKGLVVQWTAFPHMPLYEQTHMPAGSKQLVVALVEIVEQLGAGKLVMPEFEVRVAFGPVQVVAVVVRRGRVEALG